MKFQSQIEKSLHNFWWVAITLGIVAVSSLFLDLGRRQFTTHDEGRFAEIGREIAASPHLEDWVVQKLNGEIYESKPPLFPALIALSYKLFGSVDERAALFPSACFAFLTLLICFLFFRRLFGLPHAFISVLILATSYKFFDQGRTAQVDMVMLFFVTASLFSAYLYLEEEVPRACWAFFYFAAALFATLTKGPVGLVLPSLIVGIAILLKNKWARLFTWPVLGGALLYLVGMGGWILYLYKKAGPLYLYSLFIRENVQRYVDAYDHREGPFYYFSQILGDFLPWSPFLLLVFLLPSWRKNETGKSLSFFWIWFLTVFIFFTLSGSKRSLYLLPLYPALSVLVGNGWKNQGRRWVAPLLVWAFLFAAGAPFFLDRYYDWKEKRAGTPKEELLKLRGEFGKRPVKAFRTMNPVVLYYLGRMIPNLQMKEEVDAYMGSKEKVFLLIHRKNDASTFEELNQTYPVVGEFEIKDDPYAVVSNQP